LAHKTNNLFTIALQDSGYNLLMVFTKDVMQVLEIMFFTGLIGSAIVVLISFFEDAVELFGDDDHDLHAQLNS
jgi:hypothetical protein